MDVKRLAEMDLLLQEAIEAGLRKGDANMVRAYNEIRSRETSEDVFASLAIEITNYTVADTSLQKIVLEAPDYIIDEIYAALAERKRLAEFGGLGGANRFEHHTDTGDREAEGVSGSDTDG